MTSLHRKWSGRVHLPTGAAYGSGSSVAECLNWYKGPPDQDVGPCVTFENDVNNIETSRIQGELKAKPATPLFYRSGTPKPPTGRPAWTVYTETTAQDYGLLHPAPPTPCNPSRLAYQNYTHRNGDTYREGISSRYDPENEERLRDVLLQKQIDSYERQIEYESVKLQDEREREAASHLRGIATPTKHLNERILNEALMDHSRDNPALIHMYDYNKGGTVLAKPPVIPRPPFGKSAHIYPKTCYPGKHVASSSRIIRPCSGTYRQPSTRDYHHQQPPLVHVANDTFNKALTTRKVNFQTPRSYSRPGSAANMRELQNSDHFFQWRDSNSRNMAKEIAQNKDQLWKMSRFKSAHPRIDNKWDNDSYSRILHSADDQDKGKVNVNVECNEGNNMNIDVSVSKTPSTPLVRFL